MSVNEHGHLEPGHAQSVRDAFFIAEIRQADNNAVNLFAVLLEQIGATAGVGQRFDRAKLRQFRGQADRSVAFLLERLQHFVAAVAGEHGGEESPVADDNAECGAAHGEGSLNGGLRLMR